MSNQYTIDTIFALASAPGRGGIAVVRVSGPAAGRGLLALTGRNELPPPGLLALCAIKTPAPSASLIDKGMAVYFKTPASYTGEDVAEYHIHGGPAVIEELLSALSALPCHRLAEPGEFTRRAFENGKMDLTTAEAVADLINAETQAQKSQALAQLEGSLSRLYDGWRETLTKSLAHAEAEIEFPDEDVPQDLIAAMRPRLTEMIAALDAHLDDNRRGEILRGGVQVAVIGVPNAGKSSLVNALARRDVAIVSDVAGTTRDIIEAHLNLGGYPVILADTAGLRPEQLGATGHDAIESEGIRRALLRAQNADIKILLFDATQMPDEYSLNLIDENSVIVANKIDCHPEGAQRLKDLMRHGDSSPAAQNDIVEISAATGKNLDMLIDTLIAKIKTRIGNSEAPALTRRRHRSALEDCRAALLRATQAKLPELMAEDMRLAVRALGRITGRVDVEDLLDVIFRDFCIGK
ncbi:MAG TPA: tRNA uridine-5-carboxymethylaminomethyl(34) synthesis GTPase MnmE [Rhodospirillaceae bacterium]|nr:tRNA uridine-5-carboxymethylaminomethyl(34) synthesis GTPase MnmE [Rhodospirillaceae bacterium]